MSLHKQTSASFWTISLPQDNEQGPIVMEQILATLYALKNRLSFEVWSMPNKIQFAFWGYEENKIRELLENHYSGIAIQRESDFTTNLRSQQSVSAYLDLEKVDIYPIRRYSQTADRIQKQWTDPWPVILSRLKVVGKEIKGVQIILSPCSSHWGKKGRDTLEIIEVISSYWLFSRWDWFQSIFNKFVYRNLFIRIIFLFLTISARKQKLADVIDHRGHDKETLYQASRSKLSQMAFQTSIRLIYCGNKSRSKATLCDMANGFYQFNIPEFNSFVLKKTGKFKDIERRCNRYPMDLSVEELAGILHFPGKSVKTSELVRSAFKPLLISEICSKGIIVGKSLDRSSTVSLFPDDIKRHIAIFGKTGTGKSTFILNLVKEIVSRKQGIAVFDPHGDLLHQIIKFIPMNRVVDTVLIDPTDTEYPVAFNVLKYDGYKNQASFVVDAFQKVFQGSWGPRTDYILSNTVATLVSQSDSTLLAIPKLLTDQYYRKKCLKNVSDPVLRHFWVQEYRSMSTRLRVEAISPILNKVNRFLLVPMIRNILGQKENFIPLREMMDSNKILLINLSKGLLGDINSTLLGNFFLAHLQLAAFQRADIEHELRTPFSILIDELQHFAKAGASHLSTLLSEGRKYKTNIISACQHLSQLADFTESIFGNTDTLVSFGIGHNDAIQIAPYFRELTPSDLIGLPRYHGYLRVLRDGIPNAVSFQNILPIIRRSSKKIEKIREHTRKNYASPRQKVEQEIESFLLGSHCIP